jgi:hypothetical protein
MCQGFVSDETLRCLGCATGFVSDETLRCLGCATGFVSDETLRWLLEMFAESGIFVIPPP